MKIWKSFFAAAVCLMAFAACEPEQQNGGGTSGVAVTVVTDDVMNVSYAGDDEMSIEFICSGAWSATIEYSGSEEGWITFTSESEGSGSGMLTFSVAANGAAAARDAVIRISSGDESATVTVSQEFMKLNISFRHPSLLYTNEQLAKIKAAMKTPEGTAASLKEAAGYIILRADTGFEYDVESVTTATKQLNNDNGTWYKRVTGPALLAMHHALAWGICEDDSTNKAKYAQKAVEILMSWANACKDVEYPVGTEGTDEEPSTGAGMYLARGLFPFFVVYDILMDTEYISAEQDAVIRGWFTNVVTHIKASMNAWDNNDYFNKQYYQNHLCAHMWGLLSIGYLLEDPSLVQFAIDHEDNPRDFYELIQGAVFMEGDTPCHREAATAPAPKTGEIYDRYRHDTGPLKGLQYASLTLQCLSSAARACKNNGIDMYAYTAPTGENLKLAYEFYAPFYTQMKSDLEHGYYAGEDDRIAKAGDMRGLFELGYNAYPESTKIKAVLDAMPSRGNNAKADRQMHDQLSYTRLLSIDVDAVN